MGCGPGTVTPSGQGPVETACVVGGGIAGLAAARRLAHRGVGVTLIEPHHLGGRIRTSPFAGRSVDEGPDAFLARVPAAVELASELDLAGELTAPAQRSAYVYVDDELHRLPSEQVLGVPTDLNALLASRICTRSGIAALRRDIDFGGDPLDGPDVAIGTFLRDRLGEEVTERLVAPLVGGINAGDIDRLSLAAVTPQLDAAARSGRRSLVRALAAQRRAAISARPPGEPDPPVFLAPLAGMGRLVEALVAELEGLGVAMLLGDGAAALQPSGAGWEVAVGPTTVAADAVVLATPAPAAAGLLTSVAPETAQLLAVIAHAGVVLVTFAFDPAALHRPLDGSGFLVPRTEGMVLTAASWSSAKWAQLAPDQGDGTVLIRASAGRAGDERALQLDDDSLVTRLVADLRRTMGGLDDPVAARVSRYPASFPQYAPGHPTRITQAEASLAAAAPGVALAGAALRGVGIPACIASGTAAADRLLPPP